MLHDISVEIPKGKTVALIGPSGAGKTTLADIILGLLPPTSGTVRMDQHDVYENLRSWREKLGYIPQSIYLSDDTIRNNVAFGIYEDQIDEDAIWKALEKAQLKEFVQGLEKGLDTYVGDRGVRLSGGQRQRIGIARALTMIRRFWYWMRQLLRWTAVRSRLSWNRLKVCRDLRR